MTDDRNPGVKVTTQQCPCCKDTKNIALDAINVPVAGRANIASTVMECKRCHTEVALYEPDGYSFAMFSNGPWVNDAPPSTFPRLVDGQFQVSADNPRIQLSGGNEPALIQALNKLMEKALIHPVFHYFMLQLQANAQPLLADDGVSFTSAPVKEAYESLFGDTRTTAELQAFVATQFNTVMLCPDTGVYLMAMREPDGRYSNFYTTVLTESFEDSDIISVAIPLFGWALWECDYLTVLKNISVAA